MIAIVAPLTDKAVRALYDLTQQTEQAFGRYTAAQQHAATVRREVEALQADAGLLTMTEAALATLLSTVSEESLRSIEQTVSYGLNVVFDDLELGFHFKAGQARGGQVLEPVLACGGVEQPILDSFGGGPAALVAFLLRLLVTHRLGLYPLLLLDETFAMVSAQYVPNLSRLLVELAATMKFTFLLVSHQPQFAEHATRVYDVQTGMAGAQFTEVTARN